MTDDMWSLSLDWPMESRHLWWWLMTSAEIDGWRDRWNNEADESAKYVRWRGEPAGVHDSSMNDNTAEKSVLNKGRGKTVRTADCSNDCERGVTNSQTGKQPRSLGTHENSPPDWTCRTDRKLAKNDDSAYSLQENRKLAKSLLYTLSANSKTEHQSELNGAGPTASTDETPDKTGRDSSYLKLLFCTPLLSVITCILTQPK